MATIVAPSAGTSKGIPVVEEDDESWRIAPRGMPSLRPEPGPAGGPQVRPAPGTVQAQPGTVVRYETSLPSPSIPGQERSGLGTPQTRSPSIPGQERSGLGMAPRQKPTAIPPPDKPRETRASAGTEAAAPAGTLVARNNYGSGAEWQEWKSDMMGYAIGTGDPAMINSMLAAIQNEQSTRVTQLAQNALLASQQGDMQGAADLLEQASWYLYPGTESAFTPLEDGTFRVTNTVDGEHAGSYRITADQVFEMSLALQDMSAFATYRMDQQENAAATAGSAVKAQQDLEAHLADMALKRQQLTNEEMAAQQAALDFELSKHTALTGEEWFVNADEKAQEGADLAIQSIIDASTAQQEAGAARGGEQVNSNPFVDAEGNSLPQNRILAHNTAAALLQENPSMSPVQVGQAITGMLFHPQFDIRLEGEDLYVNNSRFHLSPETQARMMPTIFGARIEMLKAAYRAQPGNANLDQSVIDQFVEGAIKRDSAGNITGVNNLEVAKVNADAAAAQAAADAEAAGAAGDAAGASVSDEGDGFGMSFPLG